MDPSETNSSLCDHFLISMPHLKDRFFEQSLTYICEHNEHGAMGLVVNRPMDLSFKEILGHLEISIEPLHDAQRQIYAGGPVQVERGFILHSPTEHLWSSSYAVNERLHLTTSVDILRAIAEGWGPEHYLITLGYAGWGAGQLEQEILHNSWLSCPADLDILFATESQQRLDAAAGKLGVNLDLLTAESGHA
ncbi:YqgE/AlgH family protein [Motiliproteus sp.]|uniref:YqgE/AlgH family protein n=1 Tax=Motiliproteus sp. TaxID=1898955 RepID=UPI003BA92F51